jgi:hypothetical protein
MSWLGPPTPTNTWHLGWACSTMMHGSVAVRAWEGKKGLIPKGGVDPPGQFSAHPIPPHLLLASSHLLGLPLHTQQPLAVPHAWLGWGYAQLAVWASVRLQLTALLNGHAVDCSSLHPLAGCAVHGVSKPP